MKTLLVTYFLAFTFHLCGQSIMPISLSQVKDKIESVSFAEGQVTLKLDVDFINMPEKTAEIIYESGKPIRYTSENFIFIPKKGLDFSWNNLFRFQFLTVDRGTESINGRLIQTLNIIPDDKKADFAIMTLNIDLQAAQIVGANISTKNEGSYQLKFEYKDDKALPSYVEASFELQKVKIPLNFMGNDTNIDRKSMRSEGQKTGKVFLTLEWSKVITR